MIITYEIDDLIASVREDIAEFGKSKIVMVWCKTIGGRLIFTNYDFITPEMPISTDELEKDERIMELTLGTLLEKLMDQNRIF